jgi:hypothetical protein
MREDRTVRRIAIALVAASGAALLMHPLRAEACQIPPGVLLFDELADGLTGIPVSGVVPIYVLAEPDRSEPGYPRMVVRLGGQEIAGDVEVTYYRLIWRAAAPLEPNTTYTAILTPSSWESVTFTFTTGVDNSIPSLFLYLRSIDFGERYEVTDRICCDPVVDTCGSQDYTHCWVQSAEAVPTLSLAFELAPEAARYYSFEYQAPGAASSVSYVGYRYGGGVTARYTDRRDEYCITVRALSLTGSDEFERTVCRADSDMITLPPFAPQAPYFADCEEAPVDPDTGEVIDTGGCTAGAGAAAWWLPVLIVAASRRRRRAGG